MAVVSIEHRFWRTDEFERHARLGLPLGDVGEDIEDQEIEPIGAIEVHLEIELAPSFCTRLVARVNWTR